MNFRSPSPGAVGSMIWGEARFASPQDQTRTQAVSYEPLYTTATFDSKSVDHGLPVGTTAAAHQVSLTGAATYSIPFALPPGLGGMQPSLGITYHSQGGNGLLGMGWNLSGLSSVQRTGKTWYHDGEVGPVSTAGDPSNGTPTGPFALDGQRLVAINGTYGDDGTEYRTEAESFARIRSYSISGDGPTWFRVDTKDGITHQYGNPPSTRLNEEGGSTALFWAINRSYDQHGNAIDYKYQTVNRELLIDEIVYYKNDQTSLGPLMKVTFTYEDRDDPNVVYLDGSRVRQQKLLTRVTVWSRQNTGAAWQTEREYVFDYGKNDLYSQLIRVTEYGSDGTHFNETIFQYGDASPNFQSSATTADYLEPSYNNFTGDFDGDGFTDLIKAKFTTDINGVKYYQWLEFYRKDPTGNEFTFHDKRILPVNYTLIEDINVPDQTRFQTSDFDGDGRAEILLQRLTLTASGDIELDEVTIFGLDQNLAFQEEHSHSITGTHRLGGRDQVLVGDFDGDQRTDYLTRLRDGATTHLRFSSPGLGLTHQFVSPPFLVFSTIGLADQAHVLDYDGDGKSEIMVIHDFITKIYTFKKLPNSNSLEAVLVYHSGYPTKWHHVRIGDFNGDGKSDLFTEDGNGLTEVAYSTGKGNDFQTQAISMAVTPNLSATSYGTPWHLLQALDLNGDGKTELVHMEGPGASQYTFQPVTAHVYYTNGLSFFHQSHTISDPVQHDWPFFPGDYNGDGGIELFFNRLSGADRIYRFRPEDQSRLLKRVSNGFDQVTAFSYRYLTEGGNFYQAGSGATYPLNDVVLPIAAVESVTTPDGIGGTRSVEYAYQGAKVHRQGRGWLGFGVVETSDALTDRKSVQSFAVDEDLYLSLPTSTKVIRPSDQSILSTQVMTYSLLAPGTNNPITAGADRYWVRLDEQVSTNLVTGAVTTDTWTYDTDGNLTYHEQDQNGVASKRAAYLNYQSSGSWMPYLPGNITTQQERGGQLSTPTETCLTYTPEGALATRTTHCGQSEAVTTTYTYNAYGQPLTESTSSAGLPTRNRSYTYDGQQRLSTTTGPLGTESVSLDVWGNPHTETAINGLTTTHQYDGFGRLTSSTDPLGLTTTVNLSFGGPQGLYHREVQIPGQANEATFYDAMGREVLRKIEGFDAHQWSQVLTTYDSRGRVATETQPHFSGQTPELTTYTYDQFDRPTQIDHGTGAGQTAYTYTDGPHGQGTVTTTLPSGQSHTETFDATGKTQSRSDGGGTLTMSYNPRGQLTQVQLDGNTLTTMTYDSYGRQTSLYDANAGTTTYQYNAYGQLISQTDAQNQQTTMQYDVAGRITQKNTPEGISTYQYYSTGLGKQQLERIDGPDATQIMLYDADERVRQHLVGPGIEPVEFIDTAGCGFGETKNPQTQSTGNPEEANLLLRHLAMLFNRIQSQVPERLEQGLKVGIITPYKEQVRQLRKQLQNSPMLADYADFVDINTVDGFQGRERDVVYISLVRSNKRNQIGFLRDIRRMNVALTRARQKLVVVGDSATLGEHPFYRDFLDYVETIGAYRSAWEFVEG